MIKSFIKKYILPKEVDFITALQNQSTSVDTIVQDFYSCFMLYDATSCDTLFTSENKSKEIRVKNMNNLLNTFITPIDRESIYRVISQLDWIAESVRHFALEAKECKVTTLQTDYSDIMNLITEQSQRLNAGFMNLNNKISVVDNAQAVRDGYEKAVKSYIIQMASLSQSNDLHEMFVQRELLAQLREISKRLQICANSLEDIVIKMS